MHSQLPARSPVSLWLQRETVSLHAIQTLALMWPYVSEGTGGPSVQGRRAVEAQYTPSSLLETQLQLDLTIPAPVI